MNIDYANTLFESGALNEMYKAGFVNEKFFIYREIYLWIQAQLQTGQINKNKAVIEAEIKFNKDKRTIWRALNSFTATNQSKV